MSERTTAGLFDRALNPVVGSRARIRWKHVGGRQYLEVDIYIVNVLKVTPKTLNFTGLGQTMTITVTEPGTSAWTAVSTPPVS